MKIAPISTTDPWYQRAQNDPTVVGQPISGQAVDAVVDMEQIQILHHGPERNYRPFLHLHGRLASLVPVGGLPYGIDELPLTPGTGADVDAYYEFDNDQLAELVRKDYFSQAFQVPEAITGIPWELPGTIDGMLVYPRDASEYPLVFASLNDRAQIQLDEESSGYRLADSFPDYTDKSRQLEEASLEGGLREREALKEDILADLDYSVSTEHAVARPDGLLPTTPLPTSVFERLVADIEQDQELEESLLRQAAEADPNTLEGSYRVNVAEPVEEALRPTEPAVAPVEVEAEPVSVQPEPEVDEVTVDDEGYLKLDVDEDDEELDVAPVDIGADAHARAAREQAERARQVREQARRSLVEAQERENVGNEGPEL